MVGLHTGLCKIVNLLPKARTKVMFEVGQFSSIYGTLIPIYFAYEIL